jgi:hypothetical protein
VSRLHRLHSAAGIAACLLLAPFCHATDTYDGAHLSIPAMMVGNATYSNVVVTVGSVIGGPDAGLADGIADRYDPATGKLTVPAVAVGAQTYYNVTVTVRSLESVGSISGADSYVSGELTSPTVQAGGSQIHDVALAVTPADIVSYAGGMPLATVDQFDPATGRLLIPSIQAGSAAYTNVTLTITAGDLVSVGSPIGDTAGGFWIPFGEVGTVTGLGVMPSNLANSWVTQVSTTGTEVDLVQSARVAYQGTTATSWQPYAQVYAAKGSDGFLHIYSLPLANQGSVPKPVQVSSFFTPANNTICPYPQFWYSDVNDPSSAWIIFTVAAPSYGYNNSPCYSASTPRLSYMVRISDTPNTGAIALTDVSDIMPLLNGSGTLAGIVGTDSANNLNFYPAVNGAPSFASPRLIASAVSITDYYYVQYDRNGTLLPGGSVAFVSATSTATPGAPPQLLRIADDGSSSVVFTASSTALPVLTGTYDNANYYFYLLGNGTTYYSVPLTGGSAMLIQSTPEDLTLLDSDGSRLILATSGFSGASLLALPITPGSSFATLAGGANYAQVTAALDYPSGQIFANFVPSTGPYVGEIVTGAGVVTSPPTSGTYYLVNGLYLSPYGTSGRNIPAIEGITSGDFSMGGGALFVLNMDSLAQSPILQNGTQYVVPDGTLMSLSQLSTTVFAGAIDSLGNVAIGAGLVLDLSRSEIVVTPSDVATTLSPYY